MKNFDKTRILTFSVLTAGLLIAPVAGIAAAVGKYFKQSKTVSKGA